MALVTGSGQGIGRAIAVRLAARGMQVAVNDLGAAGAAQTAEDIRRSGGTAIAVTADISDPRDVDAVVSSTRAQLGPPSVLVNNAAAMSMVPLADLAIDEWRRVLRTNLDGAFYCLRAVVPDMREAGGGRVVNIASAWGLTGAARASHYAASKAGLLGLTKAAARDLGPDGITVNAIAPAAVDTPQLEVDARDAGVSVEEIRARYATTTAIGRIGTPEDVAAAVAYLVSAPAGCVTGQVLCPDGGTLA